MVTTFSATIGRLAGRFGIGGAEGVRMSPLTWYRDDSASPNSMRMDDFMNVVLEEEAQRGSAGVKES